MDEIAAMCDTRFVDICSEPCGAELVSFKGETTAERAEENLIRSVACASSRPIMMHQHQKTESSMLSFKGMALVPLYHGGI